MKTKTVYTSTLQYAKRIRICYDEYTDGNLYIGLYTMSGYPYSDITTNLGDSLRKDSAYVKANSEAEAFIKEQNLGKKTRLSVPCGFNTYNLYKFNI